MPLHRAAYAATPLVPFTAFSVTFPCTRHYAGAWAGWRKNALCALRAFLTILRCAHATFLHWSPAPFLDFCMRTCRFLHLLESGAERGDASDG